LTDVNPLCYTLYSPQKMRQRLIGRKGSEMRRSLVYVFVAAAVLLVSSVALAGDLFSLDMKYAGPEVAYPVEITIEVHKGKEPANLKGTSTGDFDGTTFTPSSSDAICEITDVTVDGGLLCVFFTANGYRDGEFEADSYFDLFIGEDNVATQMHTSCSKPIFMSPHPYETIPFAVGNFYVLGMDGTCGATAGDCPPNPYKLQWIYGKFSVPCDAPANLTVNLYKDTSDLKGYSIGYFDGTDLTGVFGGGEHGAARALIDNAEMVDDIMNVYFYGYGWKGNGEFDKNTRFELVVGGCGTFNFDLHTSCSQEIFIGEPGYDLVPEGHFEFVNGCGACIGYVPVEDSTWGTIKSLYR